MNSMQEVVAARPAAGRLAGWKAIAGAASAVILSLLFLASGIWKLTDLDATAERMVQSLVPVALSAPAALAVAICETFAGVLLLIPRYRRWGAWIAGLMLVAFMVYIGVLYDRLLGDDCNCFPWIRRVVGPAFFAGDAAMLALAGTAAWWSGKSEGWRRAALIFCCVCVVACGSFAASAIRRAHADAPETATVDGQAFNLRQGRVLLYFFDPECSTCYAVAQKMSKRDWGTTRIVALATREQSFARAFLNDSGLRAGLSPDAESLRKVFPFTDPPYAVALDRGKAVAMFNSGQLEVETYYETLKRLGHLNWQRGQERGFEMSHHEQLVAIGCEPEGQEEHRLRQRMARIRRRLVVVSGKGGVGKSTAAANLAIALSSRGHRVGLLDVDIHGPSIPKILGCEGGSLVTDGQSILPMEVRDRLTLMSTAFLIGNKTDAVIWCGPMKFKVIQQFLCDVSWGDLDYLVVDCPPGTGDEPLSVAQLIGRPAAALLVTTPQELAVADVRRCITFCQKADLPIAGVLENMSGYVCAQCGVRTDLFGTGGGERLSQEMSVPFLGRIPIDPRIVGCGDAGICLLEAHPESPAAQSYLALAGRLHEREELWSGASAARTSSEVPQ